jgi:hypothetical protein
MKHAKAFELLPLYSLDALELDDQRDVESHVARCRGCQEELRRYGVVASALSGEMEPSLRVWDGILERIQAV